MTLVAVTLAFFVITLDAVIINVGLSVLIGSAFMVGYYGLLLGSLASPTGETAAVPRSGPTAHDQIVQHFVARSATGLGAHIDITISAK